MSDQRGMTLIEVLVVLVLSAVALLAISMSFIVFASVCIFAEKRWSEEKFWADK